MSWVVSKCQFDEVGGADKREGGVLTVFVSATRENMDAPMDRSLETTTTEVSAAVLLCT